jgi:hypothetical protein
VSFFETAVNDKISFQFTAIAFYIAGRLLAPINTKFPLSDIFIAGTSQTSHGLSFSSLDPGRPDWANFRLFGRLFSLVSVVENCRKSSNFKLFSL